MLRHLPDPQTPTSYCGVIAAVRANQCLRSANVRYLRLAARSKAGLGVGRAARGSSVKGWTAGPGDKRRHPLPTEPRQAQRGTAG